MTDQTPRMTAATYRKLVAGASVAPGEFEAPKVKREQPEAELTMVVAQWLRLQDSLGNLYCRWSHVANERRDKAEAIKAWKMGVESGVPDFLICLRDGRGAMIELKADRGSLTPEQRKWRDDLERMGWLWRLAKSLEEVESALRDWGAYKPKAVRE